MPHVTVKLWPGKSAESKQALSNEIAASVARTLGYGPDSISVGMVEVAPGDWMAKVYEPEIASQWDTLTKRPGYGPGKRG